MVAEEYCANRYDVLESIGYGASSKVYLGRAHFTDELVALKLRKQASLDPFHSELDFL
jgi:serine/threonine protein kinase